MKLTYSDSGVDADKADSILDSFSDYLKTRPKNPLVLSGIGPYASCFSIKPLLTQYDDPILVTSCDGVGTKAKLAQDWGGISELGEDLIAMNVNDILCVGATPLMFLDYYACGKLKKEDLLPILKSIQKGCEMAGCSLVGGETAEMPGVYQNKDFDLAGFTVGVVDRKNILGETKVQPNQAVLGIASTGIHSNGYSLIRKIVEKNNIEPNQKTPFSNQTFKEALLKPTEIYVSALKGILNQVAALAHITGGGITNNLPRVLKAKTAATLDLSALKFPPLFQWIQQTTGLSQEEMLCTFNCGIGMIAICDEAQKANVISHVQKQGLTIFQIGRVTESKSETPSVIYH